jgi:release factor glutamine methyltransferase
VDNEVWTPLKLLKWTAEYFKKYNVEEPRLDAELLLANVLGVDRIMLYAGFERVIGDDELKAFRGFVKERAAGRPAKYILGRTEFYSLAFRVDERVLIPRPETELLVERTLSILKDRAAGEFPLVVEIGTGSGAIAIALAKNFAGANFVATDVCADALELARDNAKANGIEGKIEFLKGDLLEPLVTMGLEGKVDVIVSNPPYVSEDGWRALPREIREHEPRLALVAGPEGTEVQVRIVDEARNFLRPGGALLEEMDSRQKDALSEAAARYEGYAAPVFYQDYAKLWRVVELVRL